MRLVIHKIEDVIIMLDVLLEKKLEVKSFRVVRHVAKCYMRFLCALEVGVEAYQWHVLYGAWLSGHGHVNHHEHPLLLGMRPRVLSGTGSRLFHTRMESDKGPSKSFAILGRVHVRPVLM